MKNVTNINGHSFDGISYEKFNESITSNVCNNLNKLIDEKINILSSQLAELQETKELISSGNQIYLLKDNSCDYCHIDANGDTYEYRKINNKPILIDTNFNLYEIIKYSEMHDYGIKQDDTRVFIEKVLKTKKL